MEVNVSSDFIQSVLESSPNNMKMHEKIAEQMLASIDPNAMASFLLTRDAAVSLLSDRLKADPDDTLETLQTLPRRQNGEHQESSKPSSRQIKTPPKNRKAKAKTQARAKSNGKRRRLSSEEVDDLKKQVKSFLRSNRWATRKQLTEAVALRTQAIYRRIMGELQEEGVVVSEGEKSKAVYGLARN